MPERILRGDAETKLVTQSRDLPCSPAGTAIRTFVRTKYTPSSFQSQAALFAEFAEGGGGSGGGNHPQGSAPYGRQRGLAILLVAKTLDSHQLTPCAAEVLMPSAPP